jgi:acyl-coenzyme A thioesterase PaaI-like protein
VKPLDESLSPSLGIAYLVPSVGERFRAEATLVGGGKRQAFAEARLIARSGETETLAAKAAAVLIRLDATPAVGSSKL